MFWLVMDLLKARRGLLNEYVSELTTPMLSQRSATELLEVVHKVYKFHWQLPDAGIRLQIRFDIQKD